MKFSIIDDFLVECCSENNLEPEQIEVYSFPQTWDSTALGFTGFGGQTITTAQTVVLSFYGYYAWVYFGGRLAYKIKNPNRVFYEDVMRHNMSAVFGSGKYYGG